MVRRFSRTSDPFEAVLTAEACLLASPAVGRETTLQLLGVAVQEGKGTDHEPRIAFVRGLARYRAGDYDGVEQHLSAVETEGPLLAATAVLLRSMTCRQRDQLQDAGELLEQAEKHYARIIRDAESDWLRAHWNERLVYEVLYEEARRGTPHANR